jgi:hypothetical protein
MKWSWLDLDKGVLTIPPENDKVGRLRDERAGPASVLWPSRS